MSQWSIPIWRGGGRTPFVGRSAELAALQARLAAAGQGEGGVVLIAGEPGIGKTRLAGELAEEAQANGWTVLAGRAYQAEGLPPYLPFVEALRAYVRAAEPETLRRQLGQGARDVALLVRDVRAVLPEIPPTEPSDAEIDRHTLFESIADFLIAIAQEGATFQVPGSTSQSASPGTWNVAPGASATGLLLVLDDLHWADVSSLQLLLHLSRRIGSRPVLLAGTYRDVEVDRGHPLSEVLAELVRAQMSADVPLRGLGEAEVGRFIELATDAAPTSELVSSVHRETEGNPLFVAELVRLLLAEGRLGTAPDGAWRLTIPQGVRQVIGRRLDRLSAACNQALTLAAVIGREFPLLALEQAGDLHGDRLLEALEEAEAARVIAALADVPGRYAFTHPLIRETLYAQVLTSRRVRLHRQVGEALERLYAANPEPYLAELAHHFFQAAPGGDVVKAAAYARRAGDRAMTLFAYEDAARLYASALQALTLARPDEPLRCELMLALGEAQTRAGETGTGKETFQRTAALAGALGLAEVRARAALGYGGYRGQPGHVDGEFVRLAEAGLAALGEQTSGLRARLLARLAMELYFEHATERCEALSRQAIEVARASGDTAALAAALVGRHYATHTPDNLAERLAISTELIRLAEAAGDREVALQGLYLRTIDTLEAGDVDGVDEAIAAHERLAADVRQPLYLWRTDLLRSTQAALEGRFADAAALARRGFDLANRAQIPNGLPAYGAQALVVGLLTGVGLDALEPGWRSFAERTPRMPSYRAGLMLLCHHLGREADAREQYAILTAGGMPYVPRDDNFFPGAAIIAEICAHLGDTDHAGELYDLLAPYADRTVVVNAATAGMGAVAEYLGMLATTLRRWDAAERHFEEALAINTRLRSRTYALRTRLSWAEMLRHRGAPGDAERAGAWLAEIAPAARAIGLASVANRAARLSEDLGQGAAVPVSGDTGAVPLPDGLTIREVEVLRLLAAGRTNREIADDLVLSARTVDHHIANIYRKINARRRGDAAAYAQRHGLAPSLSSNA